MGRGERERDAQQGRQGPHGALVSLPAHPATGRTVPWICCLAQGAPLALRMPLTPRAHHATTLLLGVHHGAPHAPRAHLGLALARGPSMCPMPPPLCPLGHPASLCPQHPVYLCPPGCRPRGSPPAPGGAAGRSGGIFLWAARGATVGVPGAQGHLTAGGPGQGHLPLSKDAPGLAAGNFPRHTLFPSRGGAAMPPLFLKAQQAVHPLLFVSLPLVRPQPWPPNLAGRLQSSPWPRVSLCPPQLCGSSHRSSIPRSGPSPNPPPARARLMKAGRPVPIRQGASLNREQRGLPRALWLAPGPELVEQPTARCRQPGTGGWGSPRLTERASSSGHCRQRHQGSDALQPCRGLCLPPWPPGTWQGPVWGGPQTLLPHG